VGPGAAVTYRARALGADERHDDSKSEFPNLISMAIVSASRITVAPTAALPTPNTHAMALVVSRVLNWRFVIAALTACSDPRSDPATECYRFDQPYFQWIWKPGRELVVDSSALIELRPRAAHLRWTIAPAAPMPMEVRVRYMVVDSALEALQGGMRYWRPITGDSIEIWWYDGLSGPTFRLARRGDSLVGIVDYKTDVGDAPPRRRRATAVRVPCRATMGDQR
jgi:hypothetical protein